MVDPGNELLLNSRQRKGDQSHETYSQRACSERAETKNFVSHQLPTSIVVLVATPMALVWLPKVETA
jgi:hypothetical protein